MPEPEYRPDGSPSARPSATSMTLIDPRCGASSRATCSARNGISSALAGELDEVGAQQLAQVDVAERRRDLLVDDPHHLLGRDAVGRQRGDERARAGADVDVELVDRLVDGQQIERAQRADLVDAAREASAAEDQRGLRALAPPRGGRAAEAVPDRGFLPPTGSMETTLPMPLSVRPAFGATPAAAPTAGQVATFGGGCRPTPAACSRRSAPCCWPFSSPRLPPAPSMLPASAGSSPPCTRSSGRGPLPSSSTSTAAARSSSDARARPSLPPPTRSCSPPPQRS